MNISDLIQMKLTEEKEKLKDKWRISKPVKHLIIDDLLPRDLVLKAYQNFPDKSLLTFRDDMRERKFSGAETARFHPLINEMLMAFQEPGMVKLLEEITELPGIEADATLYASGLSLMEKTGFLNPHLDNSHDRKTGRYRILNALYYITPEWSASDGGSLELWDSSRSTKVEVAALYNRLVIMQTDRTSWHSVNTIQSEGKRCCISNYYFSKQSPVAKKYRHVTVFKARPEQGLKRILFDLDGLVRNGLGKVLSNKVLLHLRKIGDKAQE